MPVHQSPASRLIPDPRTLHTICSELQHHRHRGVRELALKTAQAIEEINPGLIPHIQAAIMQHLDYYRSEQPDYRIDLVADILADVLDIAQGENAPPLHFTPQQAEALLDTPVVTITIRDVLHSAQTQNPSTLASSNAHHWAEITRILFDAAQQRQTQADTLCAEIAAAASPSLAAARTA